MKIGKKELVILIPLLAIAILLTISFILKEDDIIFTEAECQEGWFKYELESGVVCAKTELSQAQLDGFGQ